MCITVGRAQRNRRSTQQKLGKCSPVLRLTIHKVGNPSPKGCVGDSRQ
ncbi:MAG: hypothetical protein LBU34_09470 [Planctomycetaceae bacterium]|nr:hypothetical protein [Planctomycetaceae bacterium]